MCTKSIPEPVEKTCRTHQTCEFLGVQSLGTPGVLVVERSYRRAGNPSEEGGLLSSPVSAFSGSPHRRSWLGEGGHFAPSCTFPRLESGRDDRGEFAAGGFSIVGWEDLEAPSKELSTSSMRMGAQQRSKILQTASVNNLPFEVARGVHLCRHFAITAGDP